MRFLLDSQGDLEQIETELVGSYRAGREKMFVQVQPLTDAYGIDWLSVIVIPESDFLASLIASSHTTVLFLAVALILAIVAGVWIVKRVTRPLEELATVAQAIGNGDFVPVPHSRRLREIHNLSHSVEDMSAKLRASLKTLQDSEKRLRLVIEKSPIAVFVVTKDGQFTDVNPSACAMTGYSREMLLRIGVRGLVGSSDPAASLPLFERLASTGRASGETKVRRKNGDDLWIQIDATQLDTHQMIAFCADITQRKQTEESLRHQQKMESLGTMARGVAHEINNPLMGMMSLTELMETKLTDPEIKAIAKDVLREGERIAHITRNLLSFAREDRGTRHPADIRDIIADSLPLVHNALLRSHVVIREDLSDAIPEIECARSQIQQVIVNLIMNARDALDAKYPGFDDEKTIHIAVHPVENESAIWVRVSIQDHGIGMPEGTSARAFDPFFTTKPRDEATGLGLTISFGIIQEHGGDVGISSIEGEGTTVHLDLPSIVRD